jgi:hypothetical protein
VASLHPDPSTWPLTLDQAVTKVLEWLNDRNRLIIRDTHEDDLAVFPFGLGMSVRHSFGLWRGNDRLLESCGEMNADDAARVIIHAVWRQLQNGAPDRRIPRRFNPKDDLTRYLLRYYSHLITPDEKELMQNPEWFAVGGPDDPERLGLARLAARLEQRERAAQGQEEFYRGMVARILLEHASEVVINRCPACNGVCNTPKAKQCWQCGHNWH